MKKILFVVAAIAMIGAGLSAADLPVEVKATVAGEAGFTFGYNLDPAVADGDVKVHGIANFADASVVVTLVSKQSHTEKGEGEVYAEITIADIEITFEGDDDDSFAETASIGDITAKIYLGPVVLNVLGVENTVDSASVGQGFNAGNVLIYKPTDLKQALLQNPGKGFSIALKDTSMVKFEAGVSSKETYVDSTNEGNVYNFFATVGLGSEIVKGLSLDVAVGYTTDEDNLLGFDVDGDGTADATFHQTAPLALGVKAAFETPIMEGYTLKVGAGLDYTMVSNYADQDPAVAMSAMQIGAGLALTVPGAAIADADYFGLTDIDYNTGVSIGFATKSVTVDGEAEFATNPMAINATLFDADLIPVLDLLAVFEYNLPYEIDGGTEYNAGMGYAIRASATVDIVSVWGEYWTINNDTETFDDTTAATETTGDTQKFAVGVDIKPINLVTVTLKYTSGDMLIDAATATSANGNKKLGVFEATVKVSF